MDQAEGLRRLSNPKPVRVVAISSGKGGVGKTNASVNLAAALAKLGRRAMIMDADLGLANVDLLLGLQHKYDLSHVIKGERNLEEIIVEARQNLKVIPASSGVQSMTQLTVGQLYGLIHAFSELTEEVDVLLVDTAAGIADNVLQFGRACQEVLVVVRDEPTSITDAYALIKLLHQGGRNRFHVLANMAHTPQEGRELFNKLVKVVDHFLGGIVLDLVGTVPYDVNLARAVKRQEPVVEAFPKSPAAQAFTEIAKKMDRWPAPSSAEGDLEFFVERLVQNEEPLQGWPF